MLGEDLRNLLGDAADGFMAAFAGQRIWIPLLQRYSKVSKLRPRIVTMLGEQKAGLLFEAYGGEYMYVPGEKLTEAHIARRKVAEMHRNGATIDEISKAVGKSRRTIFRWLNLPHKKVGGDK